jgi:hypothetical protein
MVHRRLRVLATIVCLLNANISRRFRALKIALYLYAARVVGFGGLKRADM